MFWGGAAYTSVAEHRGVLSDMETATSNGHADKNGEQLALCPSCPTVLLCLLSEKPNQKLLQCYK